MSTLDEFRAAIAALQFASTTSGPAERARPAALKQARTVLGLKQGALSDAIGYAIESVCRWENGTGEKMREAAVLAVEALVWRALKAAEAKAAPCTECKRG